MNVVKSEHKASVKTGVITLGTATMLTLGGGGYHSESTRPQPSYDKAMVNLGKATKVTLARLPK